jgi:hypothetical protein
MVRALGRMPPAAIKSGGYIDVVGAGRDIAILRSMLPKTLRASVALGERRQAVPVNTSFLAPPF